MEVRILHTNYEQERDDIHEFILEMGIATEKEISLVTAINGYNIKALNDILEVQTGYDYEQHMDIQKADEEGY
jgi:hypothetical protein